MRVEQSKDGAGAVQEVRANEDANQGAPNTAKSDRILGAIGGAMIVLALILFVNALIRPSVTDGPPRLELLEPTSGDIVSQPLTIRFSSTAPLTVQPGGWGVPSFHIHVEVAGVELMPNPNDLRPAAVGEYLWELPTLESGPTTMQLFWADAAHRAVADGSSRTIEIEVR